MTDKTDTAEGAREPVDRDRTRRAVAELFAGSDLTVRELKHEIAISNPDDPEKGQVLIEYDAAHVTVEQMTFRYLGQLEGFEDEGGGWVTKEKIIEALSRTSEASPGIDSSLAELPFDQLSGKPALRPAGSSVSLRR
jgi:hypothetical protein